MKKSILNIGKTLKKTEQKHIHGGLGFYHSCDSVNIESICNSREECYWIPGFVGNDGYCNLKKNDKIPHLVDV